MDVDCQSNNSYVRWVISFHWVEKEIMLQKRENRSEVNSQHCFIQSCNWKLIFTVKVSKKGCQIFPLDQGKRKTTLSTPTLSPNASYGKREQNRAKKTLPWVWRDCFDPCTWIWNDFKGSARNRHSGRAVNSIRDVLKEKKMKLTHVCRLGKIDWVSLGQRGSLRSGLVGGSSQHQ